MDTCDTARYIEPELSWRRAADGGEAFMANDEDHGTIIRGVGGELYFIPTSALEPFRIEPSAAKKIESRVDELLGDQVATSGKGLRADTGPDDQTVVALVNLRAFRKD